MLHKILLDYSIIYHYFLAFRMLKESALVCLFPEIWLQILKLLPTRQQQWLIQFYLNLINILRNMYLIRSFIFIVWIHYICTLFDVSFISQRKVFNFIKKSFNVCKLRNKFKTTFMKGVPRQIQLEKQNPYSVRCWWLSGVNWWMIHR